MADAANPFDDEPVEIPVTGELDLHTFRAGEIADLLPGYFEECRKRGILTVRVIHGKGTGTLRAGVHRLLDTLPQVASWTWPAGAASGGWGATWVFLAGMPPDGQLPGCGAAPVHPPDRPE
ncbi:MAG: Smr/MutS family protein [Verrucomicrobiaceae bacterium]|nr:Smr/MutS family protein [Verrucomicrobiaceae bacterium]